MKSSNANTAGRALALLATMTCLSNAAWAASSAQLQWEQKPTENFIGREVAVDSAGSVYTAGDDANTRYVVAKYSAQGSLQWRFQYPNPGVMTNAVDLDAAGQVVFAGTSFQPAGPESGTQDLVLVQLDPAGKLRWQLLYPAPEGKDHYAVANFIVHDAQGNLYVACETGYTVGEGPGFGQPAPYVRDIVLLKVSPDGALLWTGRYPSALEGETLASAHRGGLVLDRSGNLYLAADFAVLKFDPAGKLLWKQSVETRALALDPDDNLIVTSPRGTVRLSPDGKELARVNAGGTLLVVRPDGIWTSGVPGETLRLDASLRILWRAPLSTSPDDEGDQGILDLAVDASGSAHVAGYSGRYYGLIHSYQNYASDYIVVKYDPAGKQAWLARRERTTTAQAIALDATGAVLVTGSSGQVVQYREVAVPPAKPACPWWNPSCWSRR